MSLLELQPMEIEASATDRAVPKDRKSRRSFWSSRLKECRAYLADKLSQGVKEVASNAKAPLTRIYRQQLSLAT